MLRALLILAFLSGCGPRDHNYEALVPLNTEAKLESFKRYSVAERMRLYKKVYRKSGHPPDTTLATGFNDRPDEAFSYILLDLQRSSIEEFVSYLPILYSLSSNPEFDICQPQRINGLRRVVDSYELSPRQRDALEGMSFQSVEACRQFRQQNALSSSELNRQVTAANGGA